MTFPPPRSSDRVRSRATPLAIVKADTTDWWTPAEEIVARIRTQHWEGLGVCPCWICTAAIKAGIGANELFLAPQGDLRPEVKVADE